jgi:hypothetical protein
VGLARLALVTLSGLPVFAWRAADGRLDPLDVPVLLVVPWTWGALTGLLLAAWVYEPAHVRRWGQRVTAVLILVYLVVGVLAGEKLRWWLMQLPDEFGRPLYHGLVASYEYSPFGVLRYWTEQGPAIAWERLLGVELGALGLAGLLAARAARRLQPHFHERHYQPARERAGDECARMADRPLSWWAVRRVMEYSGRSNLWLAGGFALLYAAYSVAGPHWPAWMGKSIFALCDRTLGLAGLATALVVLAAVPAAFQYGLWDPSVQDRCRRLELLLLTRLDARDYWNAAAAAAWRRGRGYFVVAAVLWAAAVASGRASPGQVTAAAAAGVLLWGLYFAVGFRAFTSGAQANGLGLLLTVGVPLGVVALYRLGLPAAAALLPPGGVYSAAGRPGLAWALGCVAAAGLALAVARWSQRHCEDELRRWYDLNHGRKVLS